MTFLCGLTPPFSCFLVCISGCPLLSHRHCAPITPGQHPLYRELQSPLSVSFFHLILSLRIPYKSARWIILKPKLIRSLCYFKVFLLLQLFIATLNHCFSCHLPFPPSSQCMLFPVNAMGLHIVLFPVLGISSQSKLLPWQDSCKCYSVI